METRSAPPGRSDSDKKKRPAAEFFPAAVESVALVALVAAHAVVLADATEISLVQTVLTLTVPGVPDIYQGAELWEQSLVDPDNRLPVDFQRRADLLDTPLLSVAVTNPIAKFEVTRRLLKLRRVKPAALRGRQLPAACRRGSRGGGDLRLRPPAWRRRSLRGRAAPRCTGAPRRADPDCIASGIRRFWSPVLTDAATVRRFRASFDRSLLVVMHTDDRPQCV